MRYLTALCLIIINTSSHALPTANAGGVSHAELLRVAFGLLLVLMLILLLSWLVKRLNGTHFGAAKGMHSIASMSLGPKEKIMLLQAGPRYLLVGVAAGSLNLLYDFGTELPAGFDPDNKSSFADAFKSALGKSK